MRFGFPVGGAVIAIIVPILIAAFVIGLIHVRNDEELSENAKQKGTIATFAIVTLLVLWLLTAK